MLFWRCNASHTLPTGIPGNYFVLDPAINGAVQFKAVPFVAEFEAANDAVIFAYKVVGDRAYSWGTCACNVCGASVKAESSQYSRLNWSVSLYFHDTA